jgi:hypothetical protein
MDVEHSRSTLFRADILYTVTEIEVFDRAKVGPKDHQATHAIATMAIVENTSLA